MADVVGQKSETDTVLPRPVVKPDYGGGLAAFPSRLRSFTHWQQFATNRRGAIRAGRGARGSSVIQRTRLLQAPGVLDGTDPQ
jgi:hypothetical protein